ncbi:V-type proton ATPase subunit D 1 like protein [Argiope bruennichi]|uniref:V-type proton ATPase subunit D 1 like protein n=1 Tax=Argiope bruennichi TaxID=94029 RepID=A0A8T0G3U1_ARGBR|nr:V-type proton ATPase subunit D 1 like protein [Argiope bruennichi]
MKSKLSIAQKGHDILKRKSEVLEMRFRKVGKEIIKIKRLMGDIFKEASFLLAEARFIIGDFNQLVLNAVSKARLKVKHRTENVAGVSLQIFEFYVEGGDTHDLTGLAKGGAKLMSIKQTYTNAVEILVELATLQTTFVMLDDVIKSLNRRVNSLEQMHIPKVERTIRYIETEMDERERQDFFRMKKIQGIKKKDMERKEKQKREFDATKSEQK